MFRPSEWVLFGSVRWLLQLLVLLIVRPVLWVGATFFGWGRIAKLDLPALGDSVESYEDAVGPRDATCPGEVPGTTMHDFELPFHLVRLVTVDGNIAAVVVHSARPSPADDLSSMMGHFGGESDWKALTPGYSYRCAERGIQLWCSVMPIIGVGTKEYLAMEAASRAADEA